MNKSTELVFISLDSLEARKNGKPHIVWEEPFTFTDRQKPIEMEIDELNQCETVIGADEATGYIVIPQ